MPSRKKHGGKRPNAGRPKGTTKPDALVSKSIAMSRVHWRKLDRLKGDAGRGRWVMERIDEAGE